MPTMADGECQQDRLIAMMAAEWGAPIGYKVGLASRAAQRGLGVDAPIAGVLFDGMILEDIAGEERPVIALRTGALLVFELDLLARISSDDIAAASTIEEVASRIDQIIPFIEVPDLMIRPGAAISAPLVAAMNVAPRWGVVGKPIAVDDPAVMADALAAFSARLETGAGDLLAAGRGSDLDGHPYNIALFLIAEAARRGWTLRQGDYISLGSLGAFKVAIPGLTVRAVYEGLPGGTAEVSVRFE
ncbi:MAG: hydratase [Alphaproteobacteria bacterium]|nr:hydratase [Alphaproteobacteria bacterium]